MATLHLLPSLPLHLAGVCAVGLVGGGLLDYVNSFSCCELFKTVFTFHRAWMTQQMFGACLRGLVFNEVVMATGPTRV